MRISLVLTFALVKERAPGRYNVSRRRHRLTEAGTAKTKRVTDAVRATYEIVPSKKRNEGNEASSCSSACSRGGDRVEWMDDWRRRRNG